MKRYYFGEWKEATGPLTADEALEICREAQGAKPRNGGLSARLHSEAFGKDAGVVERSEVRREEDSSRKVTVGNRIFRER